MTSHPYSDRPGQFYWRTGVTNRGGFGLERLWQPKIRISDSTKFMTLGSCFAQNISRRLIARGYHWIDAEPAPDFTSDAVKRAYNYGIFSCRTGNIYTARMLRQWLEFAFELDQPKIPPMERDGRLYDPYRQQIEPDGFASIEELEQSRLATFAALRRAFIDADVFIFTLGLTEAWTHQASGQEYSMCPGVIADSFNPEQVVFVNHGFREVFGDIRRSIKIINRARKRNIRVLLTVSPVPLTATASDYHVLHATTYSKSVLRAAAGEFAQIHTGIDYFPSYDLITAPISRGMHYASNMRQVTQDGIDHVMTHFFDAIRPSNASATTMNAEVDLEDPEEDLNCDEIVLDGFAKKS